ncbi:hypothetical protein H7J08_25705 [Mycobacterium frederiksbergense]|uniref:MSCRAMM family adhesin SdrC n=1 Tax=Mycolicibacterium frederiksbergense TaxID=117567 RepID=UPI0021F2A0E2|nr:MSCRAMM family adhesin SdrC [Mycolicibacterium frederiksbergense]MCV7048027.1 hypothetical protein [Mycolicibacterium frederiksbergense]
MAMTGASVIAAAPVASNLPALGIAQQRAVELAAFENPFAVLYGTVSNTFKNLSARGGEINATLLPNLSAILGNEELQRELAVILFRPETVAQQLQDRLAEHQETLRLGYEQSQAGWAAHNELLPGVMERAQAELLAGHFTEAFAHINDWFIFGLGAAGWPLYPSFAVPGQVARDVGGPAIGAILDALLVGDTTLAGYPHAILVPFVSAIFRFTDSLDEIHVATQAGDVVTAVSHMVNLPAKVLNAFLNGYRPSIADEWAFFPGILTAGGPIDSFLVQYPTLIAKALGLIPKTTQTVEEPTATLAKVSSTDTVADSDLVTLSVETATGGATPVESVAASTETEESAETTEETVVSEGEVTEDASTEDVVTEDVSTEDVSTEDVVTEDETETAVEAPADTAVEPVGTETTPGTTDTETDAKADAKDDSKAASKDDSKADSKADSKDDSKADAKADKSDAKSDKKADSASSSTGSDRKSGSSSSGNSGSSSSD